MNILYFHPAVTTEYRGQTVRRRATVAAIIEPIELQGDEQVEPVPIRLRFGVSVCSEKDQFRKDRGRAYARRDAQGEVPAAVLEPAAAFNGKGELTKYFVTKAIDILTAMGYMVHPKERKKKTEKVAAPEENRVAV
jgi:hypothetical protein